MHLRPLITTGPAKRITIGFLRVLRTRHSTFVHRLSHSTRQTMRIGLLALALVPGAKAFWPFKKKRFTSESLLDAGSLGLDPDVGRIAAIGDVNGDQK